MPVDPNEPTYCLCHQVSYGEMIGCDNPDVSSKTFITLLKIKHFIFYFSVPLNGFILRVLALRQNQKVNGFVQNVHKIGRKNNSSNIFLYFI